MIIQDGDIIGDDVNVASRIEPFSSVGGVAISQKIQQAISIPCPNQKDRKISRTRCSS